MTGGTNIFGEWTTNIAAEQLNQRHLEVCVKKLEDSVYRDRDTYHIGGDWTMNGGRYDNHYAIWCYVNKDGIIYSTRI